MTIKYGKNGEKTGDANFWETDAFSKSVLVTGGAGFVGSHISEASQGDK